MRPINLIPEEQRRSHGAVSRTGPLAYIFVGALGVLLIGVVLLVLASNEITDNESKVERLEDQRAVATLRAERLAPYASFHRVAEERTQTVYSLADSRFDWSRVIRELSRILPPRVRFETLKASAGGGGEEGAAIIGPSLEMLGCAPGQKGVAAFAAALKDVDGVTRVGLKYSTRAREKLKPDEKLEKDGVCGGFDITVFEIIVAFDAAPPSPNDSASGEIAPEAEATESGTTEGETTETPPPAEAETGEAAAATTSGSTG